MIRVLVLYPRGEQDVFDYDYYIHHHIELVKEKLNPVKVDVDRGIPSGSGALSPYHVVTHMVFHSMEELQLKYKEYGSLLNADKEQFTNIQLVNQISEIVNPE